MERQVVLLIDASPLFLQSIARFLTEHAGDQIVVGGAIGDSAGALELAADLHPDIVLVGLASSAQPGLQLVPQLRAILPQAGIIVLGVVEANGYRQAALSVGADAFLLKDDVPIVLLPALMAAMRGRGARGDLCK
jgi:DNA-binding NarL/FixJ family response regulator